MQTSVVLSFSPTDGKPTVVFGLSLFLRYIHFVLFSLFFSSLLFTSFGYVQIEQSTLQRCESVLLFAVFHFYDGCEAKNRVRY